MRFCLAVLAVIALTGCAAAPPPSQADAADTAACTQAADATYDAQNYEALSRTSQTGVRFSATPNHVFDGQQMGALHVRDSQITDCERNGGETSAALIPGPPPVTPHIVNAP